MSEPNSPDAVIAWLWERPDGTKAGVVEHAAAPHWELRVTRRGVVIERHRCESFAELVAASMAAHLKTDGST